MYPFSHDSTLLIVEAVVVNKYSNILVKFREALNSVKLTEFSAPMCRPICREQESDSGAGRLGYLPYSISNIETYL